jgi:hypothetical protein
MVADGDTVAVRDVPVVTVDDTDGVMVGEGVTVTVLEPTVPAWSWAGASDRDQKMKNFNSLFNNQ